jgi:hypothetical protein
MAILLTPYDWLVFIGLAVNGLAFALIFGDKVRNDQPGVESPSSRNPRCRAHAERE